MKVISDYSGADVQVSKRGIYAPGTTNRIVSVKGSQVKNSLDNILTRIIQDHLESFPFAESCEKRDLPGAGESSGEAGGASEIGPVVGSQAAQNSRLL